MTAQTRAAAVKLQQVLRTKRWMRAGVLDRVEHLRTLGYTIERLRHNGSMVGDIYHLKTGELRLAIDAPRGKYRTAWCVVVPPFAKMKYYS